MPVGGFPGIEVRNRRTIRAPQNPLDKSTVVSIYPKEVNERKATLQPGTFHIDAGRMEHPSILVVGTSSWWKELEPDQPLLEIPTSSIQIADSIVRDYANGLFCCNMGDKMPGLFYVEGSKNVMEIKSKYREKLKEAEKKQKNWYAALVKAGDILWSRSNGNPLSIDDNMRLAAQELQLKEKPWLKDFTTMELVNCPACGELRDANFPICKHCKTVIDEKQYKELNLRQVS